MIRRVSVRRAVILLTPAIIVLFIISYRNNTEPIKTDVLVERGIGHDAVSSKYNIAIGDDHDVLNIIILAYHRSGSSLLGELFNKNKDVFYIFEPLTALYKVLLPKRLSYVSHHGKIMDPPSVVNLYTYTKMIMKSIYSCKLRNLDTYTTRHPHFMNNSRSLQDYKRCIGRTPPIDAHRCVSNAEQVCSRLKIRVTKTFRISMDEIEELLTEIPNLKVIHLLRDPRGRACSLNSDYGCDTKESSIKSTCAKDMFDIKTRRKLEMKFPGKFIEVFYERFAAEPQVTAKNIYKSLGMEYPSYIAEWLQDSTKGGHHNNIPYDTVRSDSLAIAYSWTMRMDWSIYQYFQDYCKELFSYAKYAQFADSSEMNAYLDTLYDEGKLIMKFKPGIVWNAFVDVRRRKANVSQSLVARNQNSPKIS